MYILIAQLFFILNTIKHCMNEVDNMKRYIRCANSSHYNYKLTVSSYVTNSDWWRADGNVFFFDTLPEAIKFMKEFRLLRTPRPGMANQEAIIRSSDAQLSDGCIGCTNLYTLYKGEHQMTEYTSF